MNGKRVVLSKQQSVAWTFLEDGLTNEVLYGGGAGGGKTYFGWLWQISRRLRYPGTRGAVVRNTLQSIKKSVMPTFFVVMNHLGYGREVYKINEVDNVITWFNGSVTLLLEASYRPSDPDYQRFGGLELTDLFVDEGGEINQRAYDILNTRIRWKLAELGLVPKSLMTCNPGYHWIRERFIVDGDGKPLVLDANKRYVQALVSDNIDVAFAELYAKTLMNTHSDYDRQRLLYGDWDAVPKTGGEFYGSFQGKVHIGDVRYDPELALHFSFDFNSLPYMTCTVWQIGNGGLGLWQIDEVCLGPPFNNTLATCRELLKRYGGHVNGVFVYGDPSGRAADTRLEAGHNDFTIIARGLAELRPVLRVDDKAPNVAGRGLFINEVLAGNVGSFGIVIDRHCSKTIKDYSNVKQAADGGKDKRKVKDALGSYEPYGHCSDANDYFLCRVLAKEFKGFRSKGSAVDRGFAKPLVRNGPLSY